MLSLGVLTARNVHMFSACRLSSLNLSGCSDVTDTWVSALLRAQSSTLDEASPYQIRVSTSASPLVRRLSFERAIEQSLSHFDVSGCVALTDDALLPLASCPLLRVFKVAGCCQLTDYGMAVLANKPLLEHVQLDRCSELTDVTLNLLADKRALHTLR